MNADRIIVLDDGKVVGQGTHEELLDTCEVYRQSRRIAVERRRTEALKGGDMPRGMGRGRGAVEKPKDFGGVMKKLVKFCSRYIPVMILALVLALPARCARSSARTSSRT